MDLTFAVIRILNNQIKIIEALHYNQQPRSGNLEDGIYIISGTEELIKETKLQIEEIIYHQGEIK